MNCPKCNVVLSMMERQGVEIDYCPQCRGVWLDRGELDKIIERMAPAPSAANPTQGAGSGPPPMPPQSAEYHYRRRDDDDDDDDEYRHRRAYPPQQQPGGAPPPYPQQPYYGKKKKKEGFFSDLFDF